MVEVKNISHTNYLKKTLLYYYLLAHRVLLQPGCEAMRTFAPRSTEQNDSVILINLEEHLGTIAGAVCGTLGLLLAIFAFLLWR